MSNTEVTNQVADLAYQFSVYKFIKLYSKELTQEHKEILEQLFNNFISTREFTDNVQAHKQEISNAFAEMFLQDSIDNILKLFLINNNDELYSLLHNLLFERVWHKEFKVNYSDLEHIQNKENKLFSRAILINSVSDTNQNMFNYFESYLTQHKKMFMSTYIPETNTGTTQLQLIEHPSTLEYLNKPYVLDNYKKLYDICIEKGFENHHIIMVSLGFTNYNDFFETSLFFENRQDYLGIFKSYFETIPSFQLKINFHNVPKHPSLQPVLSEGSYLLTSYSEVEAFLNRIPERN